ncbi:MAG: hypothetical protein P8Y36_06045, partial [Alphaproteobacteria bacterium]
GLENVRASGRYNGKAAIIITANHSPDLEHETQVSGLHLLRKPIKPAALRALMMRLQPRRTAAE